MPLWNACLRSVTVDAAFNADFGNTVAAIVNQPDGTILVGGYFTTVNGITRNSLARLNGNGTLDKTFNLNANNSGYTVAIQTAGKIVGGYFTALGGEARNYIVRVNSDGSLDGSLSWILIFIS